MKKIPQEDTEPEGTVPVARIIDERLRLALAVSGAGTYCWDLTAGVVEIDKPLCRLFGLPTNQLLYRREELVAAVHPEDRPRLSNILELCTLAGGDIDLEYRVNHPDGSEHWLRDRGGAIAGPDGRPAYLIGACVDIGARKLADQALRDNEQRLELAIAIAEMGTFEIDLRTDAVIVNPTGRQIYGWSPETPLTFSFVQQHFHPDDREEVMQRVGAALQPGGFPEFKVEQRIIRTDGEVRWIRVQGRAIFDESGATPVAVRCVGTYLDITDMKIAEDALRASEERFRDLADNISQLAWMTDETGSVVWYNRRWFEYTGTTFAAMQGSGWRKVPHPDFLDAVEQKFRRHVELGVPWEDTFPLLGANGQYRWFLSRAMPIHNNEGQVVRWFGTNTDVTEWRAVEEALREREERLERLNEELAVARDDAVAASAAKSLFLANMSHELRTPLNAIIGYTELLSDDLQGGVLELSRLEEDLARVGKAGRHLLAVINDILDLSKIEAGRMELADEPVNLVTVTQEAIAAVSPQAVERGNEITFLGSDTPVLVQGDFLRLRQVLINLLSNAVKFTDYGKVNIAWELADGDSSEPTVLLHITDTGVGIAPEHLPLLFEKFRQVDPSPTRRYGGAGLGLAISRRLVELMKGFITVKSKPDHGSTFTVHLRKAQ